MYNPLCIQTYYLLVVISLLTCWGTRCGSSPPQLRRHHRGGTIITQRWLVSLTSVRLCLGLSATLCFSSVDMSGSARWNIRMRLHRDTRTINKPGGSP
ncbi:hypothetical protein F4825DRAFT_411097 [Nemania diffusa]|nr:hypothetical protein F4825DRAFT_411097 [Nemania diffusa]